jgi:hypothetical protein
VRSLIHEADLAPPQMENASVARKARLCHDPGMDLEVARKALSKRSTFSLKRVVFFVVAGLCLVMGLLLRSGQYFGQPEVEQNGPVTVAAPPPAAVATMPAVETTESVAKTPPPAQEPASAPNEPAEQTGEVVKQAEQTDEAVEHAEQPESPGSGMILVSRQPIAMLASPSSSAPTTYGFPAGRPFRLIGRDGGFAKIQDLKSGASGWINEAALAPPPRVPAVSAPFRPKPVAVSGKSANPSANPKPKATKKDSQITPDSEAATEPDPVQARKRPGLFGQGGLFGGIFGNGS